jgi:cobalt-precorrin-5B (C1)-methyltransferase
MGDFAGGMLKYLRTHPVPRLTIGGGFAKLCKLAQGHLDLHSGRSQVDLDWLGDVAGEIGAGDDVIRGLRDAGSAGAALAIAESAELALADAVAGRARATALGVLDGAALVEVLVYDRGGRLVGGTDADD